MGTRHYCSRPRVRDVAVHRILRDITEESREGVILSLRDGIELVIVASGTTDGEPEPYGTSRIGAILGVHGCNFVEDGATFVGADVATLKAGCNQLLKRAVGKQVPRELLDSEAIEGKVAVKGLDHPVTVRPHLAIVVHMDAVRVCIPGGIEPITGAMLAIAG